MVATSCRNNSWAHSSYMSCVLFSFPMCLTYTYVFLRVLKIYVCLYHYLWCVDVYLCTTSCFYAWYVIRCDTSCFECLTYMYCLVHLWLHECSLCFKYTLGLMCFMHGVCECIGPMTIYFYSKFYVSTSCLCVYFMPWIYSCVSFTLYVYASMNTS